MLQIIKSFQVRLLTALGMCLLLTPIPTTAAEVVAWGSNANGQTNVPAWLVNVVDIAAGDNHTLALRRDGTVVAWGQNNYGQTNVPSTLSNVVAVAGGSQHSMALRSNGTVVVWGRNNYNQLSIPAGLSNVVAIAAGANHCLALRADSTVVAWGSNAYMETSNMNGLSNVIVIAAGAWSSLALKNDGTVVRGGLAYAVNETNLLTLDLGGQSSAIGLRPDGTVVAWGYTSYGETNVPAGLDSVVAVAAGDTHHIVLRSNGGVVAWGNNSSAQTNVPSDLTNVVRIAAGTSHSVALIAVGAPFINTPIFPKTVLAGSTVAFRMLASGARPLLYQWQAGGIGLPGATNCILLLSNVLVAQSGSYRMTASNSLGTAISSAVQLTVVPAMIVTQPQDQVGFVGGSVSFSIGVQATGNATYQWRQNGTNMPAATNAMLTLSNLAYQQGRLYSVVVTTDYGSVTSRDALLSVGIVAAWGDNYYGQVNVPAGLTNVMSVAAGESHCLALKAEGTVVGWGSDSSGQATVPTGLSNVVAVAAGGDHSVALRSDGTVASWGAYDDSSIPANLSNVVALAAGMSHTLALRRDGTVVGWGSTSYGAATIPDLQGNAIVQVAADNSFSVLLRANGTVIAWGYNGSGQTNVPIGLSNVVAIAAGGAQCFALKRDGSVVGWGAAGIGSVPAGLSNVVAVSASAGNSAALRADGTMVVWGYNTYGETNIPAGLTNVVLMDAGDYHMVTVCNLPPGTAAPVIMNSPWMLGAVGKPFIHRIIARNGVSGYGASGLPAGLSIEMATGRIVGNPQASGAYAATLYATNGNGVASKAVTMIVNVDQPSIASSGLVVAGLNITFQFSVVAANAEWYGATGMPAGLSINAQSGLISGLPSQPGDYPVTLLVSNQQGAVSAPITMRVTPIIVWGASTSGQKLVPAGLTNVVGIAAGLDHNLALRSDGTVAAWGTNTYGQINVPAGLNNVVSVAAGVYFSMALRSDGTVVGWGYNGYGQTNIPAGLNNVVAISAGNGHVLALRADGGVVGWGDNSDGQRIVPDTLSNVVAIAAGSAHSLALRANGTVVAWGNNIYGQRNVPTLLSNAVAITAGGGHSLALRADGGFSFWGDANSWQAAFPGGLVNVISIAARASHNMALRADGIVLAWGYNFYGQTNVPSGLSNVVAIAAGYTHNVALCGESPGRAAPELINSSWMVGTVGFPFVHRILAKNGATSYGATGLPPGLTVEAATGRILGSPQQAGAYAVTLYATNGVGESSKAVTVHVNLALPGISNPGMLLANLRHPFQYSVKAANPSWYGATGLPLGLSIDAQTGLISGAALTTGDYSVTLLASNQWGAASAPITLRVTSVVVWGANGSGQGAVPGGLSNVVAVAAGAEHTLALLADGKVMGWGGNSYGQTNVPSGLSNVVTIAAGSYHNLALRSNGTVAGWGLYDQSSIPMGLSNVVAVAGGGYHSLALRADGKVIGWGDNSYGQTAIPTDLSNVVAIAAGLYYSLAVQGDGSVTAWGNYDPASTPPGASNVVAIATSSYYHSLALRADGKVIGWGDNSYGQTNIPSALSNVVAFAAGPYHNLALQADGQVVAWGYNAYGQTNVQGGLSKLVSTAAGDYHSVALIGDGPPFVSTGPVSRQAFTGSNTYFRVQATGVWPLSYQWQCNNVNLAMATNPVLALENLSAAQAGNYRVVVSNAYGSVASSVGVLTVQCMPPTILAEPVGQTILPGNSIQLWVDAAGPNLTYQWRKDGLNLVDGTRIQGAASSLLAITGALSGDEGMYSVVVSNSCDTVSSTNVFIRVLHGGDVDPTFDLEMDLLGYNVPVCSILVQPDGKAVVGGEFSGHIVRFNPDGSRDTNFVGSWGEIWTMALQPDGKILVGGDTHYVMNGLTRNFLARLHPNGTLDTNFISGFDYQPLSTEPVGCIAVQPNGKILVGGSFTNVHGIARNNLVRVTTNGMVDATFMSGVGETGPSGEVRAVALQPDGKILIAGLFSSVSGLPRGCIARLNANGSVDTTFMNGLAGTDYRKIHALVLQPDGKVIIAGEFLAINGVSCDRIARLNPDGTLDAAFVAESNDGFLHALALQPDGKVLIGGQMTVINGATRSLIARVHANGTLDTNFLNGASGASGGPYPKVQAIAVQGDGRVLIGGAFTNVNGELRYNFARLLGGSQAEPPTIQRQPGSLDVLLGAGATFAATAVGTEPMTYLWRKDGVHLTDSVRVQGTASLNLSLSNIQSADLGEYDLVVANAYGSVTSRVATLQIQVPLKTSTRFIWARRVASTTNADDELAIGLAMDKANNLFVTGWFDGTNDFGGGSLTNRSGGGQDIFVAKYGPNGGLQWARRAGGGTASRDGGRGVGVDTNANVYVTGGFYGAADFGSYNASSTQPGGDFFLAKYDASGTVQWVRQSSGGGYGAYGTGLAVDAAGNSYAVGFFERQGVTIGGITLPNSEGGGNTFLVKYDPSGAFQWVKSLNSPAQCYATAVTLDKLGNVYVAGSFINSLSIDGTVLTNAVLKDAFVAKFNSSGTLQWVRAGAGDSDAAALGVVSDAQGGIYVCGGFGNGVGDTIRFDGVTTLTNAGGGMPSSGAGDAFLAKYNGATGAVQWARRAGGHGMDAYLGVTLDAQGNIYAAGGTGGNSSLGEFNAAITKYDTNGLPQWTEYSEGTNGAIFWAAPVVDAGGNCYMAGWFQNNVLFGTNYLTGLGTWDFFLTELTSNGIPSSAVPAITSQPLGRTNSIGTTVTFTVEATGAAPLSIQWRKNGTNLPSGGNVSGTTTTVLTIANLQTNDAGAYSVILTNTYGSVTSSVAMLAVLPAPGLKLTYSGSGQLQIILNGTAGTYCDIEKSTNLLNWTFVGRALVGTTLNIDQLEAAWRTSPRGFFRVGNASSQQPLPPTISAHPVSIAASTGGSASFSVTAAGSLPLAYQWRFNGTNFSGATNATLVLTNLQPSQFGTYSVVLTNAAGSITSSIASLTLSVALPASLAGYIFQYDFSTGGGGTGLVTLDGHNMYFDGLAYSEPYSYQILGANSFEIINYDPEDPTNAWSHMLFSLTNQNSGLAYDLDQGALLMGTFDYMAPSQPVLDVSRGTNSFSIGISSRVGQLVILQQSTNLTSWTSFATNISSSGRWELPFFGPAPFPRGFVRAFTPTQ